MALQGEVQAILDRGASDGDVVVEPIGGCGTCELCRAGDYNRCGGTLSNICGITRDGGMADEVVVAPEMPVTCSASQRYSARLRYLVTGPSARAAPRLVAAAA